MVLENNEDYQNLLPDSLYRILYRIKLVFNSRSRLRPFHMNTPVALRNYMTLQIYDTPLGLRDTFRHRATMSLVSYKHVYLISSTPHVSTSDHEDFSILGRNHVTAK